MKYCKNCIYFLKGSFKPGSSIMIDTCLRPFEDKVRGMVALFKYCNIERENGECGLEAKFFVQKEIKPIKEEVIFYKPKKNWWQRLFS